MVIQVKLTHSGKIGYVERTCNSGAEIEYYLQFFFADVGQRMGGYYKAGSFEVLGRSTIEECKNK